MDKYDEYESSDNRRKVERGEAALEQLRGQYKARRRYLEELREGKNRDCVAEVREGYWKRHPEFYAFWLKHEWQRLWGKDAV